MEFSEMSGADIGREIQAGRADPLDVAHRFVDAIKSHAARDEIYARLCEKRTLEEAEKASARAKAGTRFGPLDGVPVSWKDLFDTKDIATESGSPILAGRIPEIDCEVLQNATAAGTICLGKTHQTEFAFSGIGINPNTATPPNKSMPGHVPGGSSSGAAASIAHGLAPIAIGSDTGGSVRIPACWNSLVGLKTTHGVLSLKNVVPLCSGFDTVGPITKTVEDAALMFSALGGGETDLTNSPSLADLKFAVVETVALDHCDDAQMAAFERALSALEKAGAKIDRIKASEFSNVLDLGPSMFPFEAWQAWGDAITANPGVMYAPVEVRFKQGIHITKTQYEAAWSAMMVERKSFFANTGVYDAILMPATPMQPPLIEALLNDVEQFTAANLLALRNTRFANLLGTCALTLPTATTAAGLQIMGKPNEETRLLQIGLTLENVVKG
ncbi:MAG: amidase family protein [Salaquimonas sp.]